MRARTRSAAWAAVVLWAWASAATAAAAPAQHEQAGFLRHFGEDDRDLIVIADPLPHLRSLLTDARVRRIFTEGRLGKAMGRMGGPRFDPIQGWEAIQQVERYVFRELAIGMNSAGTADLDRLVRTVLLAGLCSAANQEKPAAEADFLKLQEQLLAELRQLRVPGFRMYVRLREADDPAAILEMAKAQARDLAENLPGVALRVDDSGIRASTTLGDFLDEGMRMAALEGMGLISGGDDPRAKAMAGALAGLKLEASLEARGDALVLTVGPAPGARAPLAAADLGPTFRWGPRTMFWARWDAKGLREAVAGWRKLWDEWAEKPVGRRLQQMDEEDLLGTLWFLKRQLDASADRGSALVWTEPDALRVEVDERGGRPGVPLADAKVAQLVPASSESWSVDGLDDLGNLLATQLMSFEDQLANQGLKAELRGDEEHLEVAERMAQVYYRDLAQFRRLVLDEAQRHFEAPVASLLGTRGAVRRVEVSFEVGGEKVNLAGRDLPAPEFVVGGATRDRAQAARWANQTCAAFVAGLYSAAGLKVQPGERFVEPRDLGLGVETQALSGGWIRRLAEDAGEAKGLRLVLEGDFVPHYFFVGDAMVVSTSPRLSKEVLAASRGTGRLALPKPAGAGAGATLVGAYRLPGATLGAFADHLAAWVGAMGANIAAMGADDDHEFEALTELVRGMGDVVRLVDVIESTVTEAGGVRRTVGVMKVTPASP